MRIGLLGYGNMGRLLFQRLRAGDAGAHEVVAVVGHTSDPSAQAEVEAQGVPYLRSASDLPAHRVELVVEAASQAAVRESVEPLLRQGISVVVLSVGALADPALRARLEVAAGEGRSYVYLPSGAAGGVDVLKAACMGGLRTVRLTSTKPPAGLDGSSANTRQVIFQGSAAEAARILPKNMNIATTLAMAGVGPEHTQVEVVMDPATSLNTHRVDAEGEFGRLELVVHNHPCPRNPRTSYLAVLSALALLRDMHRRIRVGT